ATGGVPGHRGAPAAGGPLRLLAGHPGRRGHRRRALRGPGAMTLGELMIPLRRGTVATVQITVLSALVRLVLALAAGMARFYGPAWLRALAVAYIEVFRGTYALVQLFWFFFALPLVGVQLSAMAAGVLVLGLNLGAYGAEVVRGALQAVPRGQTE